MKKSSNKGFTLVELIIVIAILAIIMLIAIPNFSGIQQRMQVRADKATAAQIGKAFRIWYTEYQSDPAMQLRVNAKINATPINISDDDIINGITKKPSFPSGATGTPVATYASNLHGASTMQIHTIPYFINYVDTTLLPTSLRTTNKTSDPEQAYWVGLTGSGTAEKVVVSIGKAASSLTNSTNPLVQTDVTYDGNSDGVAYLEP